MPKPPLRSGFVTPAGGVMFINKGRGMKSILSIFLLISFVSSAYSETLAKGSLVCWSDEIMRNYIRADESKKKHMEEHECLRWEKDMNAQHFLTKKINVGNEEYSISNIELRYHYYGEKVDNVWTLSKNLSK